MLPQVLYDSCIFLRLCVGLMPLIYHNKCIPRLCLSSETAKHSHRCLSQHRDCRSITPCFPSTSMKARPEFSWISEGIEEQCKIRANACRIIRAIGCNWMQLDAMSQCRRVDEHWEDISFGVSQLVSMSTLCVNGRETKTETINISINNGASARAVPLIIRVII